jgi:hypothetical protein
MNFGILSNGNTLQQWQRETIMKLIAGGHTCTLLIVNATQVHFPGFREKLLNYPYSKLVYRLWFRYMMKPAAKNNVDCSDLFNGVESISCFTTKKGFAEYFGRQEVESIRSHNLDFMLRFGFGIIKGDILDAAQYGVWSYHHDDDRKYRGVPTGFWEIMFGDPVNAAVLQRLTNKLDSGIILHKSYFGTINHSWQANFNNLLQSTTEWPLQVCTEIESGNIDFLSKVNKPESAIYKVPGNVKMTLFLIKLALNKIRFHYRDLFLTEKWNVGIIRTPLDALLQPGMVTIPEPEWLKINTRKSEYHADPFGFFIENQYHIVCEKYDYTNAKGILVSLQVDANNLLIKKNTVSLEKGYHLAFPYLFEFENTFYCIPENTRGGNVVLYRYETSTGSLVFDQVLIENLKAVDPSIVFHNGFWWLFFTDTISTNERLHIWCSSSLRGPYSPHANNPVKVDIRSSRPAGNLFLVDGKLFRPAQDCTIRSGRRISLNQVVTLSPTEFMETEYSIICPVPGSKYRKGMHTFSVNKEAIIVDGKCELFIWQAFTRKLKEKLRIAPKALK